MRVTSIESFNALNKINSQRNRTSGIYNTNAGQMTAPLDNYKKQIAFGKLDEVLRYFSFEDLSELRKLLKCGDLEKAEAVLKKALLPIPIRIKEIARGESYGLDKNKCYIYPPVWTKEHDNMLSDVANRFLKKIQESPEEFDNFFDFKNASILQDKFSKLFEIKNIADVIFLRAGLDFCKKLEKSGQLGVTNSSRYLENYGKISSQLIETGKNILQEVGESNQRVRELFYGDGVVYELAVKNNQFELANIIWDESQKLGPEVKNQLLEHAKAIDYLELLIPKS